MFGMGFSELMVLAVLALLITGPKELPKMLKSLGLWAGRLRRMAGDLRAQSGIDDVLRNEGLNESIIELRKLARGELDTIQRSLDDKRNAGAAPVATSGDVVEIVRDRENPIHGCDTYGAVPDTAILYADTFPRSLHADSALYVMGDESLPLPPRPQTPEADESVEPASREAASEAAPRRMPSSSPPVNLVELLDEATKAVTPISEKNLPAAARLAADAPDAKDEA